MLIPSRRSVCLIALLVLCAVLYWPALYGPFLFDDFPNLSALTSIDHVASWRDLGIYLSQSRSFPGRPLAMLSFLLQQSAWPDHPFPFKLVNLGLHLACLLLVYRLVWIVARAYRPQAAPSHAYWAALLAAAAWALNPIQLSGVVLVVQRMTLLMGLFVLLGLLAYLHGLLHADASVKQRGAWMALGLWVCMGLAFLSKENGILLPLYALVLDATVLRAHVGRLPRALQWWRRILIWPIVAFVVVYLLRAGWMQWDQSYSRNFTENQRLLTEPRILWDYINHIFLPRFGVYGLYHDGYAVSRGLLTPWTTLPALLAVMAAAVGGFLLRRRAPLVALALLWYLGGQLLESSTIMLELYFEHRNYTPSIGIFMALGIGIAGMANLRWRKLALLVCAGWLVACSIATGFSAKAYESEARLAAMWATQQPESVRAQRMLANQLYLDGQARKALQVIDTARRHYPLETGLAQMGLFFHCLTGDATAADVDRLQRLFVDAPYSSDGWQTMEQLRIMAQSGRCPALTTDAWTTLANTMLANPAYANNHTSASLLHYQLSQLGLATGNLELTITELQAANRLGPNADIPRMEAQYLASAGLYDDAIKTLQQTDYAHLPLLRRLLVNDRVINARMIAALRQQQLAAEITPNAKP